MTFLIGGARSGKSVYAEKIAERSGLRRIYLATSEPGDEEMRTRIAVHRARRSSDWAVVEEPLKLIESLQKHSTPDTIILVDCLTMWLSNLFGSDHEADEQIVKLLAGLDDLAGPVIVVSSEVGLGIVPENAESRAFRDIQGALNQKIASYADRVIFMAAGLPAVMKAPAED